MNKSEILETLKYTKLFSETQKKEIYSKMDDDMIENLNVFFTKYLEKEKKLLKSLNESMPRIFVNTINKMEEGYRNNNDIPLLQKIEQQISKC